MVKSVGLRVYLLLLCVLTSSSVFAAERLNIGITLHPYYSFVRQVVGDLADVTPLIEAGNNPHGYSPKPADMKRAMEMDVIVVNGIGHDEWAFEIIDAAGRADDLPKIFANDSVSLMPVSGQDVKVVNAHTFIAITAAVQQIYEIARQLGEMDPDNANAYRSNARAYAFELRKLKAEYMEQIAGLDTQSFRAATMHGAYGYLMQEFGLQIAAVIEPSHGVEPTARQLAETIDAIRASGVNVLFAEKYFASKLADTIQNETHVQIFSFSHISDGDYTDDKYEIEMRENLDELLRALRSVQGAN